MSKPMDSSDVAKFKDTLETVINIILKEEEVEKQEKHNNEPNITQGIFDTMNDYLNYAIMFILALGLAALLLTYFEELGCDSISITK